MISGVRFAPSPTGAFHVGNLRTAWISHQFSKAHNLPWVVRFEDIDRPRVKPGAQESQLRDMKTLGLIPDEVRVQSEGHEFHHRLFLEALKQDRVYACDCSRKEINESLFSIASAPHAQPPVYSGHCRERALNPHQSRGDSVAWRFKMSRADGREDFIVARTTPDLTTANGSYPSSTNFVPAYHWACAIDDHFGQYQLLVRASDLASSAPLQRAIQHWLCQLDGSEIKYPAIFHAALVVQNDGTRLEKRTQGVRLEEILARGISAEQLLLFFSTSFAPVLFTPLPSWNSISEEARQRVTLSELGL